jgi:glycosyltransferase involved in cell wall biosynthesis
VHELARRLIHQFDVVAVVPHAPGAAVQEVLDGVRVVRYRYAPARMETLVHGGGMLSQVRRHPWKWLLVPSFLTMQWVAARRELRHGGVVHAHWIIPQGVIAALLRRPFLVTSHGVDLHALRHPLAMRVKRMVLRAAHLVTVVSSSMEPMVRGAAPVDAGVEPMGVDLKHHFVPNPAVRRDPSKLLFVGRLVEKKGLSVLLGALPAVRAVFPEVRLDIAGHGPLEMVLKQQVRDLQLDDCVTFLGSIKPSALPGLYQRAAGFAAPFVETASGDQEGLGLVAIEALGCGCPVLLGAVPAVDDVAAVAPSVMRVTSGDVEAWSAAIKALLADPKVAAAAAANDREALQQRFDWDSVAARYAALIGMRVQP